MAIVVSDTSPIRALHHLGILRVLESLYGRVYVPDAVAEELRRPSRRFPAFEPNAFPFLFIEAPRDQS
jgi:predicted nucleic acid-binding protein